MTDHVWVAIEAAVRAGLVEKAVLENPPMNELEVMWLAETITDHVCGALPKEVYQSFRSYLKQNR